MPKRRFISALEAALLGVTVSVFPLRAQNEVLLRETVSREVSLNVGGVQAEGGQEAFSREVSLFSGSDPSAVYSDTISREISLMVTTPEIPERVTELTVTPSPTGDRVTLNWSGYNELIQRDVVRYDIFFSTQPFHSTSGLTPIESLSAGTMMWTIEGLEPWKDYFFAVVAVDALESYDTEVDYAASYVIAPEVVGREVSLFVGADTGSVFPETISREIVLMVTTPEAPERIVDIQVSSSPNGDTVTLDWSAYNELSQRDIVRYDIYRASTGFSDVSGRTPEVSVSAGEFGWTFEGLAPWTDQVFAVVPVDALGGFDPVVNYASSYVIAPEVVSREVSLFVGADSEIALTESVSREISLLVSDDTVPDPVTGADTGFDAVTSAGAFSAIDVLWPNYNELAQSDVVRYRIYASDAFFTDVSEMEPVDFASAGTFRKTVEGFFGGSINYLAVVAEDVSGNWDPIVRSVSAQASISRLGEVAQVSVTSFADALEVFWVPPEQVDAFLAGYRLHLGGDTEPVTFPPEVTQHRIEGLAPASGYTLRLTTVDTFGVESGGTIVPTATWLENPSDLRGSGFDGLVRLEWSHVEPNELVAHYAVYQSNSPIESVEELTPVLTTRDASIDIDGLVNGVERHFAVSTVNISDAGSPLVQSVTATPNVVPGDFADLEISALNTPFSMFAGQNIEVSWQGENVGTAATSVSTWIDRVYLSANAVFGDADDLILAEETHDGVLGVGGVYPAVTEISIPVDLLGEFHLFVMLDAIDDVYEHLDTGLNLAKASETILITPPMPPRVVREPQDRVAFAGSAVSFSVEAEGSQPLSYQWFRNGTPIEGETGSIFRLGNPQSSDAGSYHVTIINSAGEVTSRTATLVVQDSPSDLVPTAIRAVDSVWVAGRPTIVEWTTSNNGNSSVEAPWRESLYLVENSSGENPVPVTTVEISEGLAVGGDANRSRSVIVPGGLTGEFWLMVRVDSSSQVPEGAGEANNDLVSDAPVLVSAPNLILETVAAPAEGVLGESVILRWVVKNHGTAPAVAAWEDRLFLSSRSTVTSEAVTLVNVPALNTLDPGQSYTNEVSVSLPLGGAFIPGQHHVIVVADHANVERESMEGDNTSNATIVLSNPPLPDLVVEAPAAPSSVQPGIPFELTWTIANRGSEDIGDGVWRERVSVSSAASGLVSLEDFEFEGSLPAGETISRSQLVVLSPEFPAGSASFFIATDVLNSIAEENEANNTGATASTTAIAALLRFNVSGFEIAEGASAPLRASVARNGRGAEPLSVQVHISDASELTALDPAIPVAGEEGLFQVEIPGGQSSVAFDLAAMSDLTVDGDQVVIVEATAPGHFAAVAEVLVTDEDMPMLTLTTETSDVEEGGLLEVTVTRDVVTDQVVTVSLSSNSPAQLSPPSIASIPAGEASTTFFLLPVDDLEAERDNAYTIRAEADGFLPGSAQVVVLDNDVPWLTVSLSTQTVSEGDGAQALSMTVTRTPVGSGALKIEPVTDDVSLLTTPLQVTIPGGQASRSFPIGVIDDELVNGTRSVQLSAYVLASAGSQRLTMAPYAGVAVVDDDGPALFLAADATLVPEGMDPATSMTVTRNTVPSGDLTVTLTSDDPTEATVPTTVTIPDGSVSTTFELVSLLDDENDGNQSVQIEAMATGFTSGYTSVVVSDTDLPDLIVSGLIAPGAASPRQTVPITYRVTNQGLAPALEGFLTRVFLSRDAVIGDDVLVAQFRNVNPLPVGTFLENTIQAQLPLDVGRFWVVVETDVEQSVSEILENNNTRISAEPIDVLADYSAWVEADIESAPSGTPVDLHGQAVGEDGSPVPGKPVNVHLVVRGIKRVLNVTTDAVGAFSTTFTPLPGEGGQYSIFATHPGVKSTDAQDEFSLFDFSVRSEYRAFTVVEGTTRAATFTLENLTDVPLTGLSVSVAEVPAGMEVDASGEDDTLSAFGTLALNYNVTAAASEGQGVVKLLVETAEGVTREAQVSVSIQPLHARLVVEPKSLYAAMPVGGQSIVDFEIVNLGGKASDSVTVSLPGVPWMQLAVANPLPALSPGETNRVTVVLTAPESLPLGLYDGNISVTDGAADVGVPFSFRAMSESVGDLRIEAVDEFTYYAEGEPKLGGATVTVRDAVTQAEVAKGTTDENGIFFVSGLNEDHYDIEVRAEKHSTYRRTHRLTAGITNELQTFLSRQTVTYSWTVEPVEIEDRYRVTIDSTFETVVPVPVVTIEPSAIDLADIEGDETQVDIKITNHGLIAANAMQFNWPTDPLWEFTPLIEDIGTLAARSSITVPVTIRRTSEAGGSNLELSAAAHGSVRAASSGPCILSAVTCWELECGNLTIPYCQSVALVNPRSGCIGDPPRPPYSPGGGGCIGCEPVITSPVSISAEFTCDPECLVLAGLGCIPGPIGCAAGGFSCGKGLAERGVASIAGIDCVIGGIGCVFPPASAPACIYGLARCFIGPAGDAASASHIAPMTVSGARPFMSVSISGFDPSSIYRPGVQAMVNIVVEVTGIPHWFELADGRTSNWFAEFASAVAPTSESGRRVSGAEREDLLNFERPPGVSSDDLSSMIDRWNLTLINWETGRFDRVDEPDPSRRNFIDLTTLIILSEQLEESYELASTNGYTDPFSAVVDTIHARYGSSNSSQRTLSALTANSQPLAKAAADEGGICARVKIRLEQDAVLTRDAFRATLELENNDAGRLEDVMVEVFIRPQGGEVDDTLFAVRFEEASVLSAVDGTGILPGDSTGTASWLLIPTIDAAPRTPRQFLVGGSLSYTLDGESVTVPIYEAPITVYPSPRLSLQYFHQRDVFADDPFTDLIEPSLPYSLAVMARNNGYGVAKNFHITSAQPKIIENEKGLLIDFNIIASEVAGQPVSPSLTVNLGDIDPGDATIGRWLLTSSLQGLFIDYEATFEHVDGLGNPRLSLIDEVTIHEMNHLVRAGGVWDDGEPDFLVNDIPDLRDLPDTLYQSNGTTNHVEVVEDFTLSGTVSDDSLSVTLNVLTPGDWVYIRVPDPGEGEFSLDRVLRSDGAEILVGTNVWTTDRTFIGAAKRPIRENILHLIDHDSTGSYELQFVPGRSAIDDDLPPVSAIATLPDLATQYFQVSWSGKDEGPLGQAVAGIAFYDIFVSENGGPFLPWLERTPLVSATYSGEQNATYSFYSIATDANGNREPVPGVADTTTVVGLVNSPPVIDVVRTVRIDEGLLLDLPYFVSDPDVGQALTVTPGCRCACGNVA